MTAAVSIRMEEDLKESTTRMLESMGLTLSGFVNMAARQLLIQRRLPFQVIAPDERVLNEETRRALLEADAKDAGLIEDDAYTFATGQDAVAFLRQL